MVRRYYALKPTKFSDRVFTFLDKDASGKLDFREYCLGIWNYCTYDVRQMARVAFSFFDVEKIGMIDMVRGIDMLLISATVVGEGGERGQVLAAWNHVGRGPS